MATLEDVFKRVSAWNAARYDRVYDKDLSVALLDEELQEYFEATLNVDQFAELAKPLDHLLHVESVDRLDALCDVIYVAMGVIWKLNITEIDQAYMWSISYEHASELIAKKPSRPPTTYAVGVLSLYKSGGLDSPCADMQMMIIFCVAQMKLFGLTEDESMDALLVVCDSNDSKAVKKTDPTVKANIDKGSTFIAPELRLQMILDKVTKRAN